ncbi:pancreatic triacylglycerol lipase-like [Ylistrum balloti]|uniref:pancreatic triacylglycerol lipase-like n=1 Tax=Ylistrum balloti TaxID=509963 RepID=UPI002905D15C|nr:pancreatic triacylglycerol lipase-like [Ylistrum balloti]
METGPTARGVVCILLELVFLLTACTGLPLPLRNLPKIASVLRQDVTGELKTLIRNWELDFVRRLDGLATGKIPELSRDTVGSSVCYGDLGCFSTGTPFFSQYRPINFLPARPDQIDTRFLLYTRGNRNTVHYLNPNDVNSITNSPFSGTRQTKFVTHGFLENGQVVWLHDIKNEFLKAGDYNVIIVGWGGGSGLPYTQATSNTRVVGAEIARMIHLLQQHRRAHPSDMHVIGHSLGAHVAGYAGARTQNLGRITGLDPADPYFQYTDPEVRLDHTDAMFVDVIHTDGESILKLGFGMMEPCGHVDYFPNNGENQPGCSKDVIENVKYEGGLYNGGKEFLACNHLRSYKYFNESINSACPWQGYRCDSFDNFKRGACMPCSSGGCGYMGLHADRVKPPPGTHNVKYYLETGSDAPFCRYHYSVRMSFGNPSGAQTWSGHLFASIHGTSGQLQNMQLTTDPVSIQPGTTFGFVVTSPTNLGRVMDVDVKWEHHRNLLNPLSWNPFNLRHPSVYVSRVDVVHGESNSQFSLCGATKNTNIETQGTMNFAYTC